MASNDVTDPEVQQAIDSAEDALMESDKGHLFAWTALRSAVRALIPLLQREHEARKRLAEQAKEINAALAGHADSRDIPQGIRDLVITKQQAVEARKQAENKVRALEDLAAVEDVPLNAALDECIRLKAQLEQAIRERDEARARECKCGEVK